MKFLSRIRSRSKSKQEEHEDTGFLHPKNQTASTSSCPPNPTAKFPSELLEMLLSFICPHSQDKSYAPCEDSMMDGGCMLCDMRDLAFCALVNKQWNKAAQRLLYYHVRIDSVHYCEREQELAARRRRRSHNARGAEQRDAPQERLYLFSRTVRESPALGAQVQYLKMPYMTRESCKADLARTVSFLPNLAYVDLPEGLYTDSSSAVLLKQELQVRCPHIRKMKYMSGSEESFMSLAHLQHWPYLESLELHNLSVDPSTLTSVLSSLHRLNELELSGLPTIEDASLSSLPPLRRLCLRELPSISIDGLKSYLNENLSSLSLINTGVEPSAIHEVLSAAPRLSHFSINATISRPFPIIRPPPLSSTSLRTLRYEISASSTSQSRGTSSSPAESYYSYLAQSIQAGGLPSLAHLYALSPDLPIRLLTTPPPPLPTANKALASSAPQFPRPDLHLFSKSLPELEWQLTVLPSMSPLNHNPSMQSTPIPSSPSLQPPTPVFSSLGASKTRPVSLYQPPPLSPQYRHTGRESVLIGNGFGGYLTVPTAEGGLAGENGSGAPLKSPRKMRERQKGGDDWMG